MTVNKENVMFILKKIGCRAFQLAFRAALPFLPYREPKVLNSCENLGDVLEDEGARSALIVTDAGIVKNQLLLPLLDVLKRNKINYVIYDKTQPNPTVDNVEEAFALYNQSACNVLIAIGGGSSIDCAKALGARVVYPKRTVRQLGGKLKIWRRLPTFVAIPTTAGTGSEVTLAAVVSEPKKHSKYALMSFPLIPHYAVLDATLTYSLPPQLTATTGMDALTHAVEAYIGRSTTKKTRALAIEATQMIFYNLEKAYRDGNDRKARENMLIASYKAGMAFSMSYVGYIHAIAHSLGGRYGIPHGLANAVIIPYVLEGYGKSAHKKLYRLGLAVGACTKEDSYEVGAKRFIDAIKDLNAKMNVPSKIKGIDKADVPDMAKHAEREANPLYPVPRLMTDAELMDFFYKIAD